MDALHRNLNDERLTQRAQRAGRRAAAVARRRGHAYLATGHLLMGLLAETSGRARDPLACLCVRRDELQRTIESLLPAAERRLATRSISRTPAIRQVFDVARKRAHELGHDRVGTGHLLWALLSEEQGIAAAVFRRLGVELADARRAMADWVADHPPLPPSRRAALWAATPRLYLAAGGGIAVVTWFFLWT